MVPGTIGYRKNYQHYLCLAPNSITNPITTMLKQLNIQNIILIERAEISFETGLNVLSGETGSGKSAILNALSLITGDRADNSIIRLGAEKGTVEALFDIESIPEAKAILEQSGIEHEAGSELIIRREISLSGRGRAFINNQMAQLNVLKQLSSLLLDIVGQHANQLLLNDESYREITDLFGDHLLQVKTFAKSWAQENQLRTELRNLIDSESQRLRDIERYQHELDELTAAQLKEHEDEELFQEYTLLSNSQELIEKVQDISQTLSGEKLAVIPMLNRHRSNWEQLIRIAPALAETAKSYDNALIELQEIAHTLRNYHSRIEHNPSRTEEISDRLALIEKLKRRYGSTIGDIQAYQQQLAEKLESLKQTDSTIEEIREKIRSLEVHNNGLCQKLTERRSAVAKKLEKDLTKELRALNMPKVEFHCKVTGQLRSSKGDDRIEFMLQPNVGEHCMPVHECASGGELSRLMLALQVLLSGKKQTPTLIFDEIDANIGGETATIVGEKLRAIGAKHQVLCITHFPQVAKQAQHHFQIAKREVEGRTLTTITILDKVARQQELLRMVGGTV